MANSFWNFITTLIPGELARAEDLNSSFQGIQLGLDGVETEINKAIQITNAPGVVDISQSALDRAGKFIQFNASGGIELGTVIGSYQGDHAGGAGVQYYERDIVLDAAGVLKQDSLYYCIESHLSTGTLSSDSTKWTLLIDMSQTKKRDSRPTQTLSGSFTDFLSLPSWTKQATVIINDASLSVATSTDYILQLGDTGGFETTGYVTSLVESRNGASTQADNSITTGFPIASCSSTATEIQGIIHIHEIDTNEWVISGKIHNYTAGTITNFSSTGTKTLSGVLDRIRFTTTGAISMAGGKTKVICEG